MRRSTSATVNHPRNPPEDRPGDLWTTDFSVDGGLAMPSQTCTSEHSTKGGSDVGDGGSGAGAALSPGRRERSRPPARG